MKTSVKSLGLAKWYADLPMLVFKENQVTLQTWASISLYLNRIEVILI